MKLTGCLGHRRQRNTSSSAGEIEPCIAEICLSVFSVWVVAFEKSKNRVSDVASPVSDVAL
eukprot:2998300-Amphidinium_carterae.2